MKNLSTKNLVLSAFFLALGLALPFLTAQVPSIGSKLLPMHIPVLLCGFICGWPAGLLVGFVTPLFRSMIFGMPPLFPTAVAMAFELAAYGLVAGIVYGLLPKRNSSIYAALVIAMLSGRVVWGLVSVILYGLSGAAFSWKVFLAGAFINASPGIVVQIIIIPLIIMALGRAKISENA